MARGFERYALDGEGDEGEVVDMVGFFDENLDHVTFDCGAISGIKITRGNRADQHHRSVYRFFPNGNVLVRHLAQRDLIAEVVDVIGVESGEPIDDLDSRERDDCGLHFFRDRVPNVCLQEQGWILDHLIERNRNDARADSALVQPYAEILAIHEIVTKAGDALPVRRIDAHDTFVGQAQKLPRCLGGIADAVELFDDATVLVFDVLDLFKNGHPCRNVDFLVGTDSEGVHVVDVGPRHECGQVGRNDERLALGFGIQRTGDERNDEDTLLLVQKDPGNTINRELQPSGFFCEVADFDRQNFGLEHGVEAHGGEIKIFALHVLSPNWKVRFPVPPWHWRFDSISYIIF